MKKGKLTVALSSALLLALAVTGCGSNATGTTAAKTDLTSKTTELISAKSPDKVPASAKARKDTLIIGMDAPDGTFNLLFCTSSYDQYIAETVMDGLMASDDNGNMVPAIADKYTISSDGLNYTFHIRSNAKFSDGTPVTADDVAFTYTVMADPAYAQDGSQDISGVGIKGFNAYNSGSATSVSGIKVVDPSTIEFTLNKPNSSALVQLGGMGIMSKAYYGKGYTKGNLKSIEALNSAPMGCGQYIFKSFKPGQEVDLVANDNYYRGKPKIKNIIYKVTTDTNRVTELTSGDTDIDMEAGSPQYYQQLEAAGFLNIQTFPTNGYGYIGLNDKDPILSDVRVRQALAYGLNRKEVVSAVYKQYADVMNIPVSKVSPTFTTSGVTDYTFDPAKANKLLDEAGWKKGADGIRQKDGKILQLNFLASNPNVVNDALIPIAEKDYQDIGIKFVPETMDFNTVLSKAKSYNYQMLFIASGLTSDPTTDLQISYGTKGAQNYSQYSNPALDKAISDAYGQLNAAKRTTILQGAYKIVNNDLPSIPLYQRKDLWAISSRVTGFDITPYKDFTNSLWKVQIK